MVAVVRCFEMPDNIPHQARKLNHKCIKEMERTQSARLPVFLKWAQWLVLGSSIYARKISLGTRNTLSSKTITLWPQFWKSWIYSYLLAMSWSLGLAMRIIRHIVTGAMSVTRWRASSMRQNVVRAVLMLILWLPIKDRATYRASMLPIICVGVSLMGHHNKELYLLQCKFFNKEHYRYHM